MNLIDIIRKENNELCDLELMGGNVTAHYWLIKKGELFLDVSGDPKERTYGPEWVQYENLATLFTFDVITSLIENRVWEPFLAEPNPLVKIVLVKTIRENHSEHNYVG